MLINLFANFVGVVDSGFISDKYCPFPYLAFLGLFDFNDGFNLFDSIIPANPFSLV